jgi:RNA-binding protein
MASPTSPKKRALMPSTKLRKALRAAGHHLSPIVQIGKEGLTEAVLRALDQQLLAHELVKVKVGTESPEDRFEVAERMGEAASAQVAQILGRTILVYRRHPEKPRFEPRAASERETARAAAAERPRRGTRGPKGRGSARRRSGAPRSR